jgi:hypothetical protein
MEKRKRTKSQKTEQIGSVSIHVGKEEKEVQNLTLRTTVNEVILALIRTDAGQTTKLEDNGKLDEKGKEKNWVLVESWRGTERPLPPRTRLLKVWNSWKNEQCYVKFYLKKSTSISFRNNQPTKSVRKSTRQRARPNFVGATETFIDGPYSNFRLDETTTGSSGTSGCSASSATSSSTTSGSSEISVPTTTTSSEDGKFRSLPVFVIHRKSLFLIGYCILFLRK